jgi:outer membrane receptor protein involved in Fe transport
MNRKILVSAICGSLLAAGTAYAQGGPAPQNAQGNTQNNNPQTLQTIVVTGSHIRRVDVETDNPVVAISAQQIAQTGALTIGDVVQKLPVITGGVTNPSVNNAGGDGGTHVGLRGLGSSRTLILVDGQRVLDTDLNSIPTAAVERVEVLTSGASAIYGSDAIGGVINFILKSNYQGAQVSTSYGISDRNDGRRKGASFVFGQTSDKGSILAGLSYNKFEPIMQSNRKYSSSVETATTVDGHAARLPYAATTYNLVGSFNVGPALSKQFGCPSGDWLSVNQSTFSAGTSPTAPGDFHCRTTADAYNFAGINYILTPQERTNAFFKGVYHLSDNVDVYATYYHGKTTANSQLAPAVFGVGTTSALTVSKNNYYNPFGVDFSPSGADIRLRMLPIGPRRQMYGVTNDQLISGVRGSVDILDQNWQWNVGYNYGHTSTTMAAINLPNQTAILQGIATPSMVDPATGQVVCVSTAGDLNTVVAGCTPWDPFNLNSPSAKAALGSAQARAPGLWDTWDIERTYHADINGGLFNLPAGTVQLGAGVSYRDEYTNNTVGQSLLIDPVTGACQLGSQCSAHLQGGYNVKEAYAEMFIPILQDLPFVKGLNATISDRYSKYSTFGSTSNWKLGVEYRPISDLLLRGTVAKVFRAPSIGDVFAAPISSAPSMTSDPCDYMGAGANPNAGNPACKNVPATGPFLNTSDHVFPDGATNKNVQQLVKAFSAGSQAAGFPLGPEMGKSYDFGTVYSPHFVPGLSASVDFWRIYLNNTITGVGVQQILNQCFAGNAAFCALYSRTPSGPNQGQIATITQPTANLGRIDVKGVDLAANYKLPSFAFGQFSVGLQATYLQRYKIQTAPGTDVNQVFEGAGVMGWNGSEMQAVCPIANSNNGMCFYPRIRGQVNVDWQLGSWSAGWRMRGTGPFRMDGYTAPFVENVGRYGTYIYNDANLAYTIQPLNTTIEAGVNNVFDKQPPFIGAGRSLNSNTDPEDFDTIGRYYWARLTVKF